MTLRAACFAVLLGCLGCGGKQSAPAATPAAEARGEGSIVEVAPDLSPVPPPPELVLVGRVARPKVLFETLASWAGLPVRLGDALPPELHDLERVIAWDAPVEMAAVLDRRSTEKVPPPLFVTSIGLVSSDQALELARARGASVTQVGPGVYRASIDEDVTCAISPALGSASARLVCGDGWNDVEELLPYATRGLPTRDFGTNDVHLELTAEPIRRRYTQEISALRAVAGLFLRMASLDDKRFDRVLTDVAYGLADELKSLAHEIDSVRIAARLNTTGNTLDFEEAVTLRGTALTSFVAQNMKYAASKAGPPPAEFWQLPANASNGGYMIAHDPARLLAPLKTLIELADAYLEYERVAPALRKRVRRILEAYTSWSTGSSYAGGSIPGATAQASVFSTGWTVGTTDQRADALTAVFTDLAGLLQDPELKRLLKTRFKLDAKLVPKLTSSVVRVKGFPARATAYELELPPAFLERLDLPETKAEKGKPLKSAKFTIVIVPDGERSMVATAPDQKHAIQALESARSTTEPKLASVPELQAMKNTRAVWAGFWSIEALAAYFEAAAKERGLDPLTRMPNHGRTPWLYRVEVVDTAPTLTLLAVGSIPQGAFQDAGSLIPELAASGLLGK